MSIFGTNPRSPESLEGSLTRLPPFGEGIGCLDAAVEGILELCSEKVGNVDIKIGSMSLSSGTPRGFQDADDVGMPFIDDLLWGPDNDGKLIDLGCLVSLLFYYGARASISQEMQRGQTNQVLISYFSFHSTEYMLVMRE